MHLTNHIKNPELVSDNTLHVIGVCANPQRYHSRYRLSRKWLEEMEKTPNVKAYFVEAAYGDRRHEVTESDNHRHLQVRTHSQIWIKENLWNIGLRRLLPKDFKYAACIDADVSFRNPCWALETIHELQRTPVVQPWANAVDLTHDGSIFQTFQSFGSAWVHHHGALDPKKNGAGLNNPYGAAYAHSGFAWAYRRDFLEAVEKLLDWCIIGAGDHHMAWSMVNQVTRSIHPKSNEAYRRKCTEWQDKAHRFLQGRIGYVPGYLEHFHHGPKARRNYWGRWEIQLAHDYDPYKDITYDAQGVLQLSGNIQAELDICRYNRSRMEDSIESY